MNFLCLNGHDVISAKVSDHHPVIHDGVLFWNVMMQAKMRDGRRYNNGFGMIESDREYINRLRKVAAVITEITNSHSSVNVVALCEGPIEKNHVEAFLNAFISANIMERFSLQLLGSEENGSPNWGLMMLVEKNSVVEITSLDNQLRNRFFICKIKNKEDVQYVALAHLPFGAEMFQKRYSDFINGLLAKYEDDRFVLCADFNFNPYHLNHWKERSLDKIANNNSIVLVPQGDGGWMTEKVTVDGILLSIRAKQILHGMVKYHGLFSGRLSHYKMLKDYEGQQEEVKRRAGGLPQPRLPAA